MSPTARLYTGTVASRTTCLLLSIAMLTPSACASTIDKPTPLDEARLLAACATWCSRRVECEYLEADEREVCEDGCTDWPGDGDSMCRSAWLDALDCDNGQEECSPYPSHECQSLLLATEGACFETDTSP